MWKFSSNQEYVKLSFSDTSKDTSLEFRWHTVFRAHPVFLKRLRDIYIFRKEYSEHSFHVPPRFPLLGLVFDFRVVGCRLHDRAQQDKVFLSVH